MRRFTVAAAASLLACSTGARAQQMADLDFDARVAAPAYVDHHPKVLFDEAHHNFHTTTGRYKPFADLIGSDGYAITPNHRALTRQTLRGFDVLVISNALGAEVSDFDDPAAARSAFTDAECDAIHAWVRAGGSLLFIADHAPMGAAAAKLAGRFGVDMAKGFTSDPSHYDVESGNQGFIVYDRDGGGLAEHPITEGRGAGERIARVIAFTGQSLRGPAGSVAFMRLADTAIDQTRNADDSAATQTSAAGRAQGIALELGKGRVVILGEAGMLSAQIILPEKKKFGMNRPGTDNRQLALNIMHWLSRATGSPPR